MVVYKHNANVEDYTNNKEALNLTTTEIRKSKRVNVFKFCKCIRTGHGNIYKEYKMRDAILPTKDLEVTFSADMNISKQCGIAAAKGSQILGLIRRTITYNDKQQIVPMYKPFGILYTFI